ncbi:hypothetical protein ACHOLT_20565 [Desulfitobacterium sp. Sab5]
MLSLLLHDKDALNLKPYQIEAIKAAEQAVIDGHEDAVKFIEG